MAEDFAPDPNPDDPVHDDLSPRRGATGPFGLDPPQSDPFELRYYKKDGANPTDDHYALAEAMSDLSEEIRAFRHHPDAQALREDLRDLFSAVLVQRDHPPKRFAARVAVIERRFFANVVTPMHRQNLNGPVVISIAVFIGLMALAQVPKDWLTATLTGVIGTDFGLGALRFYAFTVAGTLLGRLLYFAISWGNVVTSLETYALARAQAGSVWLSLFFDLIVGVAACAIFSSGLIVIEVGTGSDNAGGFSTNNIDSAPLTAFVTGLLVGLAKTEFLARLGALARERLGGTPPSGA
jgi:hypothetical protein